MYHWHLKITDYIIPNGMIKFKKCLKIYMKISIGSKIVDGPGAGEFC